jgi:uncharacterized protein YggE
VICRATAVPGSARQVSPPVGFLLLVFGCLVVSVVSCDLLRSPGQHWVMAKAHAGGNGHGSMGWQLIASRSVGMLLGLGLAMPPLAAPVRAEVTATCEGTLLQARGQAELKRSGERLRFSLGLQAQQRDQAVALQELQQRLAVVREALQRLQVADLQVASPSTWSHQGQVTASLQLSGLLRPERYDALVREVGSLAGVQLQPVQMEANANGDAAARRQLLQAAWQDAQAQARELVTVLGLRQLRPLEVQIEGGPQPRPMAVKAMMAAAPPAFDPAELPPPLERLALQVTFCAR